METDLWRDWQPCIRLKLLSGNSALSLSREIENTPSEAPAAFFFSADCAMPAIPENSRSVDQNFDVRGSGIGHCSMPDHLVVHGDRAGVTVFAKDVAIAFDR